MSEFPAFLPWQTSVAQAWLSDKDRFAHAWLIHGMPGIGKREFAKAAAASLLCEQPGQTACGQCHACQWIRSGTHPDLRFLRPDALTIEENPQTESLADAAKKNPSREIRIDQLRQLHNWFNTATHRGGWRVAVLYPAESLGNIAANALLKVLEEPPEHTVFLIVANAPDRLLPTLVSRCRRLPLASPDGATALSWLRSKGVEQAQEWLAASAGAPVQAWHNSRHLTQAFPEWLERWLRQQAATATPSYDIAPELEGLPAAEWIDVFQRVFVDLQLQSFGLPARYFPGLAHISLSLAQQSQVHALAETVRWLNAQKRLANHPLNSKMFVHHALDRLSQACRAS